MKILERLETFLLFFFENIKWFWKSHPKCFCCESSQIKKVGWLFGNEYFGCCCQLSKKIKMMRAEHKLIQKFQHFRQRSDDVPCIHVEVLNACLTVVRETRSNSGSRVFCASSYAWSYGLIIFKKFGV